MFRLFEFVVILRESEEDRMFSEARTEFSPAILFAVSAERFVLNVLNWAEIELSPEFLATISSKRSFSRFVILEFCAASLSRTLCTVSSAEMILDSRFSKLPMMRLF